MAQVSGHPGKTKVGELSVFAAGVRMLSPCLHDIPDELKSVELRTKARHLEMLVNRELPVTLQTRARAMQALRRFLDDRGFVEVETPVLAPRVGGAAALPFMTTCRALDAEMFLRIAPEIQLKTLVIGGLERVYEIGKQFRNEGIDASHNPEFTTLEFYQAYADFEQLVETTELLLHQVVTDVAGSSLVPNLPGAEPAVLDFAPPFRRLSIIPALEEALGQPLPDLADSGAVDTLVALCDACGIPVPPPHTVPVLVDRLVGELVEPQCVQPTFLCDHPIEMSPLAKEHPTKPGCAQRFELFVNGKELCNAYQELNDPDEQRRRFAAQQADRDRGDREVALPDEPYCQALEYALPPTVGFGLGVDRLVMLLTQQRHIRDVIAFPMHR